MIADHLRGGLQLEFFDRLFGDGTGLFCVAWKAKATGKFQESFLEWPGQKDRIVTILEQVRAANDVYFCPHLFGKRQRIKENVIFTGCLWADLDTCDPETIEPKPPIVLQSSTGRWQAFWPLKEPISPTLAEEYSKRITYKYSDNGADKSGWDLTQLLRVPFTFNYKHGEPFEVEVVRGSAAKIDLNYVDAANPPIDGQISVGKIAMKVDETLDATEIIEQYELALPKEFYPLFELEPDDDWSTTIHRLELYCVEAGMSMEETFTVAKAATCNKYARDNRPDTHLWDEVAKLYTTSNVEVQIWDDRIAVFEAPQLINDDEIGTQNSFVHDYIAWAAEQSDAAKQYSEAAAFVILSSVLSTSLRLSTSFGSVIPNIWVMIVADTTLTRKTTAMDMAMELLAEVEKDAVLATDGSIEGLMTALSMRNGVPSIYLRDEVTGLLESVMKKDYMSGTLEMFTKLYDGKPQKRLLKKETISVDKPIFLIFAGGIRSKLVSILREEHVFSGFLPRFLFISAESDIDNMRPVGPPTLKGLEQRRNLIEQLSTLQDTYCTPELVSLPNSKTQVQTQPTITAVLDEAAWERYNIIERELLALGLRSPNPAVYTPTFDRMAKTLLKLAMLLAACRQQPVDDSITVTLPDIITAGRYIDSWLPYTMSIIRNLGKTVSMANVEKFVNYIIANPGASRGTTMRALRLTAQEMDYMQETAERSGYIDVDRKGGKLIVYQPTGISPG